MQVPSLGREDTLEEGMATHSSSLAWGIPWTEEPGRLQSMGSQESDMNERLNIHRCAPSHSVPQGPALSTGRDRETTVVSYKNTSPRSPSTPFLKGPLQGVTWVVRASMYEAGWGDTIKSLIWQ